MQLTKALSQSQTEVRSLRRQVEETRVTVDDLEQYGRRMNVRVEGVPYNRGESEDELFAGINEKLQLVNAEIAREDVVRFHRSAAPKLNNDNILTTQCIVKFAKWAPRRTMQGVNKLAREKNACVRVHHDLTYRRYSLLAKARTQIKDTLGHVDETFAFVNVNSNLKIRSQRTVLDFNTEQQLASIVGDLLAANPR